MDFSQLPKMSDSAKAAKEESARAKTNSTRPDDAPQSAQLATGSEPRRTDVAYAHGTYPDYGPGGFGFGGVWVSLIGGIICLLMGLTFAKWLAATLGGKTFETGVNWVAGEKAGTSVSYFELQGGTAYTDMGLFLMGIALLLDAALMFVAFRGRMPARGLVLLAVLVTGVAVALNAGVAAYLLSIQITPMTSLVALLVGGMVLFDHVPMLKARR